MPFLTQGKTNWKFIAIVAVLIVIVGGIFAWHYFGEMIKVESCGDASYFSYHGSRAATEILKKDCEKRGGTFSACGPACSDGQVLPIPVCTPSCYFGP